MAYSWRRYQFDCIDIELPDFFYYLMEASSNWMRLFGNIIPIITQVYFREMRWLRYEENGDYRGKCFSQKRFKTIIVQNVRVLTLILNATLFLRPLLWVSAIRLVD